VDALDSIVMSGFLLVANPQACRRVCSVARYSLPPGLRAKPSGLGRLARSIAQTGAPVRMMTVRKSAPAL
jgi:hypothetical protein